MGHPITSIADGCLLDQQPKSQQLETQGVQISPYTGHLCLVKDSKIPLGIQQVHQEEPLMQSQGCWEHPAILLSTVSY